MASDPAEARSGDAPAPAAPLEAAAADPNAPGMLRITVVLVSLCFGLLLSSLETSIVATALVSVASELGDYGLSHWIVVSYLLTYTAFMLVYARISDVYGKKPAVLAAVALFGLFSLGCGLASSMTALIVLRAFQGAGASGIYAMAFAIAPTMLPMKYFGASSAAIGAVYASSSILGPVLGGVIAGAGQWRWIFMLNVPPSAVIFLAIAWAYPSQPPTHVSIKSPLQIDIVGLLLSFGASLLLVFALEEAGGAYAWTSAPILGTLIASVLAFLLFSAWLAALPSLNRRLPAPILPAFPLALISRRPLAFSFVTGFLAGAPFTAALILVPQRMQLAHGLSPLQAGLRLLPLLLSSALGSALGGAAARVRSGAWLALCLAACLVVLALGLDWWGAAGDSRPGDVPHAEYAFLALLGLGFGTGLSSLVVIARLAVADQHNSVLLAGLTQVRVLGGCVGLAASNAMVAGRSQAALQRVLGAGGYAELMQDAQTLAGLPADTQDRVRAVFAAAFRDAVLVMLGFAAAAAVASLGVYDKDAKTLDEFKPGPAAEKEKEVEVEQAEQHSS